MGSSQACKLTKRKVIHGQAVSAETIPEGQPRSEKIINDTAGKFSSRSCPDGIGRRKFIDIVPSVFFEVKHGMAMVIEDEGTFQPVP